MVLILVLVEYTVTSESLSSSPDWRFVLILVLVEYTVTQCNRRLGSVGIRLNPCFSGIYCDTIKFQYYGKHLFVLILVLVEYTVTSNINLTTMANLS